MPVNLRPGAASMARAISTTSGVVFTPQRPAPQSISTKHSMVVPCFCAAAEIATPVQREASREMEERLVGELEKLGMEVTYPDLAPFREAVQPVIAKWKDTVGTELVDAAMNFQAAQ